MSDFAAPPLKGIRLLERSAVERLGGAVVAIIGLWLAVFWALS